MTDILIDENGNVMLSAAGDLVVGESTVQHQRDLLVSDKAHYKHVPTRCVGVDKYLLDMVELSGLTGKIRTEFGRDGLPADNVRIDRGKVTILSQ